MFRIQRLKQQLSVIEESFEIASRSHSGNAIYDVKELVFDKKLSGDELEKRMEQIRKENPAI